jgi:hypothetical protein
MTSSKDGKLVIKEQSINQDIFMAAFLQMARVACKYDAKEVVGILECHNIKHEIVEEIK